MAHLLDPHTADKLIGKQIALWEARRKAAREAEARGREAPKPRFGPYVTFSREEGSGGDEIARTVAARLNWDVFGKELVDFMAKRAQVRKTVVDSLDEHSRDRISDWATHLLDREFLGHHRYVKHLFEVMTIVGYHGNVVLIGRGANFILPSQGGLHVRIIAPHRHRIERLMQEHNLNSSAAEKLMRQADADRAGFIRTFFHKDITAAHHYDLVINTGGLNDETAVELSLTALQRKVPMK